MRKWLVAFGSAFVVSVGIVFLSQSGPSTPFVVKYLGPDTNPGWEDHSWVSVLNSQSHDVGLMSREVEVQTATGWAPLYSVMWPDHHGGGDWLRSGREEKYFVRLPESGRAWRIKLAGFKTPLQWERLYDSCARKLGFGERYGYAEFTFVSPELCH